MFNMILYRILSNDKYIFKHVSLGVQMVLIPTLLFVIVIRTF